jgi:signal transduction histidine kinase
MFQRAVFAIAALILLLGVLQYRWIARISEADKARRIDELKAAAGRFSQEFNSEITRAFFALNMGRPGENDADARESADRVASWLSSAPYRRLVHGFYHTRGGVDGMAEFLEFNPATEHFEPAAWPARLAELRGRMEARSKEGFRWGGPPFGMTVEEDVPAIVGMRPGEPRDEDGMPSLGGWSIAELDLEYIRKELLPELARKQFGSDYNVAVVSRSDRGRVIYGAPSAHADATAGLLDLRIDGPGRIGRGGFGFVTRFGRGPRPGSGRISTEAAGPPPGPPPDKPGPGGNQPPPPRGNRPPDDGPERGRWQLLVTHHAGSVGAAVAQSRTAELITSFGVLILLSASVALVLVSTRRAHRLALQQMEFVAGVTHELRTPLTVIASAADNLSDGVVTGDKVRRYGSVIRQESRRLTDMVEQLLRFAGLQSGRAKYKVEPVEVESVIERALSTCQPELRDSGMQVQRDIQETLPPVQADAAALVHCVANLVANAVKHARDGNWIGISARLADYGEAAVEILVEDRGPGIDSEDLPHLFEPFYRGRRAVSDQVKGAGLGLSLVKRIMEGQAGSVAVASKAGEGCVFTLRLPMAARGEA